MGIYWLAVLMAFTVTLSFLAGSIIGPTVGVIKSLRSRQEYNSRFLFFGYDISMSSSNGRFGFVIQPH